MSADSKVWATLGLDPPSRGTVLHERAVKRAYAKALKAIDQSADPAGFQSLREAYEVGLQFCRAQKVELDWRRFAADMGALRLEIAQIEDLIANAEVGTFPDSQIALDALGELGRVAVLDQSAEGKDACFVLNALLVKSGAEAIPESLLTQIEEESEAVWDTPIGVIETAVEYLAARFSDIVAEQNGILLSIHDESENSMFAIAARNDGLRWINENLGGHISIYAVHPVPDIDQRADNDASVIGDRDLFQADHAIRTIDEGAQYNAYIRMSEAAIVANSDDEWMRLFNDLGDEPSQLREDVEVMIFRMLRNILKAPSGPQRLPPSITDAVVEELDVQFQWLSDSIGFERRFQQDADLMIVALNEARGRKIKFAKILQKPNVLVLSAMIVVMYALMRTLFSWLTTIGMIS